jgi:2-keto-4-pentenoate hydratase/2-oxohepta-3-ene-1,7-dioic acid hydratase in catechol pathway
MRFATYRLPTGSSGGELVGVVDDNDRLHPLPGVTRLVDMLGDPPALRNVGEQALGQEANSVACGDVELLAPIPRPPSVRDFMTFEEHVLGTLMRDGKAVPAPKVWYRQPLFYFTNPAATIGVSAGVPMPPGTGHFDFELEVAAVIGPGGSNLTVDEAARHIAGYAIFVDWSARDIQVREMAGTLGPSKGKDTATTLGPWLVTADELEPHASGPSYSLRMEVRLDGELFGSDSLEHMGWSFAQMVAYASRGTSLVPGDVLGSGTCGGGCLAERWCRRPDEPHRTLQVGDQVTFRVEQLGEFTQTVVAGPTAPDIGTFWPQDHLQADTTAT